MEDTFDPHLYFLIMKQKTINMNNDLSIIILTFNRPSEIKKKFNFGINIILRFLYLMGPKKKLIQILKLVKILNIFIYPLKVTMIEFFIYSKK